MTNAVLNCPMAANDAKAATVRDYLLALLREVWRQEESFSGKRPFGNSSWQDEVYSALVKAGLVEGALDANGRVERVDALAADALVLAAIANLGDGSDDEPSCDEGALPAPDHERPA